MAEPLIAGLDHLLVDRRGRLREQRDHLASALAATDAWSFTVPDGVLTIRVRVRGTSARALVDRARRQGLALAFGSWLAVDGAMTDRIRLPFTADRDVLDRVVGILRGALAESPPLRAGGR